MLYILEGFVDEPAVGGGTVSREVRHVGYARSFYLQEDNKVSFGGVLVTPTKLIKVTDELVGDRSFQGLVDLSAKLIQQLGAKMRQLGDRAPMLQVNLKGELAEVVNRAAFTLACNQGTIDMTPFYSEVRDLSEVYIGCVR